LLDDAPISLQFEIVSHGTIIYACEEDTINNYEMSVLKKVQDFAPLRQVQDEYLKKRAEQWFSKEAV
jgi:hypothetical protein